MSDIFPTTNGMKQAYTLSPLLFNFALDCTVRKVLVNQEGLKLNGTKQLLVHDDNVIILGGSIHTMNKNTEDLVFTTKENGLEVNAEKTQNFVMLHD
jgi:hypothetical protein